MSETLDILIDFDGTVVTHEFPNIGKPIGAEKVLKKLVARGHRLILFTMRSDSEEPQSKHPHIVPIGGNYLSDAVEWFRLNDIPLYGIQTNPTQHTWTHSPKAYGQLMIDDSALGCPLTQEPLKFKEKYFLDTYGYSPNLILLTERGFCDYYPDRPYVDWVVVENILKQKNLI